MSFGLISEASTRSSSIDTMSFSESDIGFTQLDMDLNVDNIASQLNQHNTASSNTEQENQNQMTTPMERDPIYFCENVVLAAEDRLFCVPKSGLANHGTYFQPLFGKNSSQLPVAGSSEQHPIVLEGVSKIHLHNFLRVIYPFYGVDAPFGDEHWIGILDLATKWGFQEVQETAITHLEHLFTSGSSRHDPIVALFLCQKYSLQKYMKQQFEAIITSIKAPDSSTMLAAGINTDTVLVLKDLRDRWISGMLWGDKGSESSNIFPRRLSARRIVEDHFSALDPRPMTQDDNDPDMCWIQDEAKWLEDEVGRMKEAEKDEVAVEEKEEVRETGDRHDKCVQPGKELVDDKGSGASMKGNDVPDNIGTQIKKLVLLHHNKHAVAELIRELEEKGVNEADSEMQSLKSRVDEHDRMLWEYWDKVTGLPVPEIQTKTGSRKTRQTPQAPVVVDLGGYNAQTSLEKVEQTIRAQLHPRAKSVAFFIRLGSGSINSQRRCSVVKNTLNRYALSFDRDYRNGVEVYEIEKTEGQFGSWLERFRTQNNL